MLIVQVSGSLLSPRTFLILSVLSLQALTNLCNSGSLCVLWLESPLLYITCLNSKPSKHRIWLTTLVTITLFVRTFPPDHFIQNWPTYGSDRLPLVQKQTQTNQLWLCMFSNSSSWRHTSLRSSESGKHTVAGVAKSNLYPILKYSPLCLIFLLYIMLKWGE